MVTNKDLEYKALMHRQTHLAWQFGFIVHRVHNWVMPLMSFLLAACIGPFGKLASGDKVSRPVPICFLCFCQLRNVLSPYPPTQVATKGTAKNLYCFALLWLDLRPAPQEGICV